jgi:penicillin-binding protein 1A
MVDHSKNKPRTKNPGSKKNWGKILLYVLLIFLGISAGVFAYAAASLPEWDPAQLSGAKTTFIYDDQDTIVSALHAEENRTEITLDKVPPDLVNAFIATEDQDFYHHHGINFKGILRAVLSNITSGNLTGQGASTITQQLARNSFLSFDKKWERKIKEVVLAFKLEATYSKDEILAMYLNKINFGAGAYGVQAAANTYFGKDVSELTLEECALLAGLPQSPNGYNPFQYYERAKSRQKMVLNSMVDCGFIDLQIAQAAMEAPLVFKQSNNAAGDYGYFVDAVIDEALQVLGKTNYKENAGDAIYRSGLRIYTTMDADLQRFAEDYFVDASHFPQEIQGGEQAQSAMAVIDHTTGDVKAIMGGRKYEVRRGFNRATNAYRQPGSAIKPISVYSPALESGYMPFYVLDDSPISFKIGGTVWSPKNYDGKYRGLITIRTAVQWSINTYAVQMVDKVGVRKSFDYARAMGLKLIDSPGHNDLGLAPLSLGGLTHGATPVQMAGAYSTIANGGIYMNPHFITRIEDADGVEIYNYVPSDRRVLKEQTTWLMTNMLQTVVSAGTGTTAQIPGVATAGKTGTSEECKDVWFCGFTPSYTMAVWMGYDQKYTMDRTYGGLYPARMFRAVLTQAHKDHKGKMRPMPAGIIQTSVCSKSGKSPSLTCPEEQIITEYCTKNTVPKDECELHQQIYICPESGKLAGKYCPNPVLRSLVQTGEGSVTEDKIPTEKCDIHTEPQPFKIYSNHYRASSGGEVYICTDPRNEGRLYRANFPNPVQTGGCPNQYVEKVTLPPGTDVPPCPLGDHQIKGKGARQAIDDFVD